MGRQQGCSLLLALFLLGAASMASAQLRRPRAGLGRLFTRPTAVVPVEAQAALPAPEAPEPLVLSPQEQAVFDAAAAMDPRSGQLSPSVLVMGEFDWQIIPDAAGKPWSRCLDMVWRARRFSRGNRLNFVPTHHWLPREDGYGVSQFCYLHTAGPGDKGTCSPWTPAKLAEFKQSMTLCLTEALRQGFTPYVRPHLDDGLVRGTWRNGLLFSPTTAYGGYSFKQIMLDPLAEALAEGLAVTQAEGTLLTPPDKPRPAVYLAMQGEMSATIMRYAKDWLSMVDGLRAAVGTGIADVKIGIGVNFNALDAVETSAPPLGTGFIGWMLGSGPRALRFPVPPIDSPSVNTLVTQAIDFVGVSAYTPYTGPGMSLNEIENAAFNLADNLRSLGGGIDLAALIASGKLELHYSEFGLGGGRNGNAEMADSATQCAKQPWAGIAGGYQPGKDPWRRPDLDAFRTEFYTKTLQWLSSPGIKTYRVSDIFVWGMASWDLFGVYPDSSGLDGSYRGLPLVREISKHNMRVITAQTLATQGAEQAKLALALMMGAEADYFGEPRVQRPPVLGLESGTVQEQPAAAAAQAPAAEPEEAEPAEQPVPAAVAPPAAEPTPAAAVALEQAPAATPAPRRTRLLGWF